LQECVAGRLDPAQLYLECDTHKVFTLKYALCHKKHEYLFYFQGQKNQEPKGGQIVSQMPHLCTLPYKQISWNREL